MPARIDPETGNLLDVDGDVPRTFGEIQRITPACPRCGTRVTLVTQPVQSLAGSAPTQLYMFGRHDFNCRCY